MITINTMKENVAKAALEAIEDYTVIGVGTGSTVNYFIKELGKIRHRIDVCVASSKATELRLREEGLAVIDLNAAGDVPIYIDGADEVTRSGLMIKGGGGALTREKIIANVAQKFVCIVDNNKIVAQLGAFPIAVEVLPMARSFVAREVVKLGGDPVYREGFVTDNGHIILDVFHMNLTNPKALEDAINIIPGVIENGVFAKRLADQILVANPGGIVCYTPGE